jgi:serine/threonine protein kinase
VTPSIAMPDSHDSTPERALPAGTRLGEYEIEGVIAHSSVALVYRAYDRVLKLHVAIKEYLPDTLVLRSDGMRVVLREREQAQCFERGRQAFVHESRTLAHCDHPSLLRVMRILHHHGTVSRVMRGCAGPTLADHRLTLSGPPDATALRVWLDGLLGALAELHARGVVHGAVSPGKILMVPGRGPVLMGSDAVRAALISGSTRSMMASLAPGFMPIEQREPSADRPLGPWTDLYALAATLHFFVGGQMPSMTPADSPQSFEPLGVLWRRLHGGLAAAPAWLSVLDACLDDSVQHRPQSVAQLRALLEAQDAASRLLQLGAPSPWANMGDASAGHERFPMVAVPASQVADLQQTLPFVAARAHEITAAASAPAMPARSGAAGSRRRRWATGAALMVTLTVSVAAGEWMRHRQGDIPAAAPQAVAGGVAAPLPAHVSATVDVASPGLAPAGAGRPDVSAGVTVAAEAASISGPVVAPPTPKPAARLVARAPDSPREACGRRERYALLQCMETQCAKKAWSKHDQCVRLRKDRKL